MSFIIALKIREYLGINLIKYIKNLSAEYKRLKK
jgi:hypothetical protein